jgi:hypothetical protein
MFLVSGACSIEFFLASKDPFRVASGNKIPCPWPYVIHRPSTQARDLLEVQALESEYKKVLEDNNVRLHHTSIMALSRKGESETPRDTLVIYSEDMDTRGWKGAATIIQEIVDRAARRVNGNLAIRVELRNDNMMYRDISSIIRPGTPEQFACMDIEESVYEEVKRSCPGDWNSICYFMRGPRGQTKGLKLTLVVGIMPRKRNQWGWVEERISDALQSFKNKEIEIHIELIPGWVQLLADTSGPVSKDMLPIPPEIYWNTEVAAQSGASIGPRGTQDAGTLGTWVTFRGTDGVKQVCFLTCCHVISPGDRENQTTNEKYGIGLNGKKPIKPIIVDYPAPFDAEPSKATLSSSIAKGHDHEGTMKRSMGVIEKYIRNGGIGSVIHASGIYRTNISNRRMDWALVRCHDPSTVGKNIPPPGPFTTMQLGGRQLEVPYVVKPGEIVQKNNTLVDGAWVTKKGRTSGVTAGEVHAMKARIDWKNGMETYEIVVQGFGGDFVDRGDSGAMVTDINKEWVGMVIGKDFRESWGIITSVSDLRADIDKGTGGTICLV